MKRLLFHSLIIISFFSRYTSEARNEQDTTKFQNEVNLVLPFPLNYFASVKGELTVTPDRITFVANKPKHRKYNLDIPLTDVNRARKWGALIVPNPWFFTHYG